MPDDHKEGRIAWERKALADVAWRSAMAFSHEQSATAAAPSTAAAVPHGRADDETT